MTLCLQTRIHFLNQAEKIFSFLSRDTPMIFAPPSGVRVWTVRRRALLPELLRHLPLSSRPRVTSWEICLIWTWRPLQPLLLHRRRPQACRWARWTCSVADWTAWYCHPPRPPPSFASFWCPVNSTGLFIYTARTSTCTSLLTDSAAGSLRHNTRFLLCYLNIFQLVFFLF